MKEKYPATMATRFLKERNVSYEPRLYKYEDRGGTAASARELGVDEHKVIKTIIMEDETKEPFIVLMHGDMSISEKNMARIRGVKTVKPCLPATADKHSGYMVGGTSPFGTKRPMKTYIEKSILSLDVIYINGGKRGFLVAINPLALTEVLDSETVEAGYK